MDSFPFDHTLMQCRLAFEEAQRSSAATGLEGWKQRRYRQVTPPAWCTPEERMRDHFEARIRLWQYGIVVWGHVVQMNSTLFNSAWPHYSAPGEIIFCTAEDNFIGPSDLGLAAKTLFQLKHTDTDDELLKVYGQHLKNERTRLYGWHVPSTISPHSLVCSTLFVPAKHLPNGYLTLPWFPVVVERVQPRHAMILPSHYWSERLLILWQKLHDRRRAD